MVMDVSRTLRLQILAPRPKASSVVPSGEQVGLVHPHVLERPRRALNVAVATVGLLVSAPLFALIAVAIRLTSPGPVFFTQVRIGLCRRTSMGGNFRRVHDHGGKPFVMYKFRTMRQARPGEDAQVWASENDPRITTVGRFLRRTRLDELPQLINVLRGEMNVVGPRPEQPEIFQSLRSEVQDYAWRQRVRPGITGRAQVSLGYDSSVEDVRRKVQEDLTYIERQSVLEDVRIMAMTVPVMLLRKGSR
jgi:lipopolysaccharide/colanic/teichoic acid biosynthesis glycosyltransferase